MWKSLPINTFSFLLDQIVLTRKISVNGIPFDLTKNDPIAGWLLY